MAEKKKTTKAKPTHSIRSGNVVAHVVVHQTNTGFQYLGIELVRQFKSMSTGNEQAGTSFFPTNKEDLHKAVREAMAYIAKPDQKLAA